jgi:acetate kinase
MSVVLVVNSGSSSIKYLFIEMETEEVLGKGLIERIGTRSGAITHKAPRASTRRNGRFPTMWRASRR